MSDNRAIGIFDSGLGGLTAVTYISALLPKEKFVYFGDTARTPYGSKSIDTIEKFSMQITDFLTKHDVKIIVIACNTVSAVCLELLRKRYKDLLVIGIIEPTAKFIAKAIDKNRHVGIIGTKITVESKEYERLAHSFNSDIDIESKSCPLFVPMIEEGIENKKVICEIIKYYMDDFVSEKCITDLILGCTHYPLIKDHICTVYPHLNIINPSEIIANNIKALMKEKDMLSNAKSSRSIFYASDLSDSFISMINKIMPCENNIIKLQKF